MNAQELAQVVGMAASMDPRVPLLDADSLTVWLAAAGDAIPRGDQVASDRRGGSVHLNDRFTMDADHDRPSAARRSNTAAVSLIEPR